MSDRPQFVRLCECGCGRPTMIASFTHAARGWRSGQPKPYLNRHHHFSKVITPEMRFWAKVVKTATCWLWQGQLNANGYGVFHPIRAQQVYAHRFAYELLVGPIPEGKILDHVKARGCNNRNCVNPAHLEPVTRVENTQRGEGIGVQNARKTHCVHGHAFTEDNTTIRPGGSRQCRTCARLRDKGRAR